MHDQRPLGPRRTDSRDCVFEHLGAPHDPLDRIMEYATRGGEIVLVLDQDNSCCLQSSSGKFRYCATVFSLG